MDRGIKHLREFGDCRLDVEKKILWHEEKPVSLPLKAIELLCVLVDRGGEVVSKEEIWREVWQNSFVEETNLTHNIYLLRKTLRDLGETNLIQTVPRRGYRFAGELRDAKTGNGRSIIEPPSAVLPPSIEDRPSETELSLPGLRKADQGGRDKSRRHFVTAALVLTMIGVLFASFAVWSSNRKSAGLSAADIKSIAVLPMRSFDKTPDDETLCLRMTDSLITKLGNLGAISVRPTSSVQHFLKEETNALEAGRRLGVDSVLDGRMQREGEKVRVTLQLISVKTGEQLWSEQFDGQANRLLNLQDAISSKLLAKINLPLTPEQTDTFAKRPTEHAEAFENYLKGRYFWQKRGEADLQKAVAYFEKAIALDGNFSKAYAGLADSQYAIYDYSYDIAPENVMKAKDNLLKAIALDPDSAEAFTTLGDIQTTFEWNWREAEISLKKAVEISPNVPNSRHRYGNLLLKMRRFGEAESELRRAVELDPTSSPINSKLGVVLYFSKQHDAAIEQFKKTLELNEKFLPPYWYLSRCYWQMGEKEKALSQYLKTFRMINDEESARLFEQNMNRETPEATILKLSRNWETRLNNNSIHAWDLAILSAQRRDVEGTLHWAERTTNEHHPWATWMNAEPEFEFLRDHPRFQEILRRMNLN